MGNKPSDFLQISAWIGYFFKIDAFSLDEEEFALRWRMAQYLLAQLKPVASNKPHFNL